MALILASRDFCSHSTWHKTPWKYNQSISPLHCRLPNVKTGCTVLSWELWLAVIFWISLRRANYEEARIIPQNMCVHCQDGAALEYLDWDKPSQKDRATSNLHFPERAFICWCTRLNTYEGEMVQNRIVSRSRKLYHIRSKSRRKWKVLAKLI